MPECKLDESGRHRQRRKKQRGPQPDRVAYVGVRVSLARHVAVERPERRFPLVPVFWFACAEIDPQGAEIGGTAGLGRAIKHVGTPGDLKVHKPGGYDCELQLCFQQSTGNSTGPELNIAFSAFRNRFLHQDVTDLQPATGLQHARHFLQAGVLVGHQVQHAV